jgi:AcrR family transcriptional regulator
MPYPARLDLPAIVTAARALLEERGSDALTMRELSRRLAVSAPALYFHVESREDLLDRVIESGLRDFGAALAAASAAEPDGISALHGMADAYVAFASAHPELVALMFGPCPAGELAATFSASDEAAAPLFAAVSGLAEAEQVAPLAQTLWALVHGFTTLSLAGQFRLPEQEPMVNMHAAIDALLRGWTSRGNRRFSGEMP